MFFHFVKMSDEQCVHALTHPLLMRLSVHQLLTWHWQHLFLGATKILSIGMTISIIPMYTDFYGLFKFAFCECAIFDSNV